MIKRDDLFHYIQLVWRWLWLAGLLSFIAGGIVFIQSADEPPRYTTSTTVAIGSFLETANPRFEELSIGFYLVETYENLIRTNSILDATIDALDLNMEPIFLNSLISVGSIADTALLQISVTHIDPDEAAQIANELVRQLIAQSPSNLTQQQQLQLERATEMIDMQTADLELLREELRNLDGRTDATSLQQRNQLSAQVNEATANIGQFTQIVAALQQQSNSITLIDPAPVPTRTSNASPLLSIVTAMIGTIFLTYAVIFALDFLQDTFRTANEVTETLRIPVLGTIAHIPKSSPELIHHPKMEAHIVEAYKTLRSRFLHALSDEHNIVLVNSATPIEGKTTTAANLAISLAHTGKRVLLVDADLRRPNIHDLFGLSNEIGLAHLLTRSDTSLKDTLQEAQGLSNNSANTDDNWYQAIYDVRSIPDLYVLPAGYTPNDPISLLTSDIMQQRLEQFRESAHFDFIIIDTPPILAVHDSLALAAEFNLPVLFVVRAGRTRRGLSQQAVEQLAQMKITILGATLNGIDTQNAKSYSYYYSQQYSNSRTR